MFIPPPGWGNKQNRIEKQPVFTFCRGQESLIKSDGKISKKCCFYDFSMTLPSKFCLRTLCFSYSDWLGGGAYFDRLEDLEAGKFKKNDKFKIPNEKLHDQGGSTLKSP